MKSLYDLYKDLPREQWYYYEGHSEHEFSNPFIAGKNWEQFIRRYFNRAGKGEIFDESGVDLKKIRYPEHICSVHFLGIILYNRTGINKEFDLGTNTRVDYEFFPFLWFLTSLFHDNFYSLENSAHAKIHDLISFYKEYCIDHRLLECEESYLSKLSDLRSEYFKYRLSKGKVDHGIAAGIVLYDKLYKIREKMESILPKKYFWDESLISKYQMAADAVSIHNIWLPQNKKAELEYSKSSLQTLNNFDAIQLEEFPLFYLFGIVDTLEPLKAYNCAKEKYVLQNLLLEFSDNSFILSNKVDSGLDFSIMKMKAESFDGWLALNIDPKKTDDENTLTIEFK